MNKQEIKWADIERSIVSVCNYLDSEKNNLKKWSDIKEKTMWNEIVLCILGSRVTYEMAKSFLDHLDRLNLLDPPEIIKDPKSSMKKIYKELGKPVHKLSNGNNVCYRFRKTRSRFILKTALDIYKNNKTIKKILNDSKNEFEARKNIAKICTGIGPKQASLFLRNINYANNLAIIDSHVLRYIEMMKKNEESHMTSNNELNNYEKNEKLLLIHAGLKGLNISTYDLAIWTVMRVLQRDFKICQL